MTLATRYRAHARGRRVWRPVCGWRGCSLRWSRSHTHRARAARPPTARGPVERSRRRATVAVPGRARVLARAEGFLAAAAPVGRPPPPPRGRISAPSGESAPGFFSRRADRRALRWELGGRSAAPRAMTPSPRIRAGARLCLLLAIVSLAARGADAQTETDAEFCPLWVKHKICTMNQDGEQ